MSVAAQLIEGGRDSRFATDRKLIYRSAWKAISQKLDFRLTAFSVIRSQYETAKQQQKYVTWRMRRVAGACYLDCVVQYGGADELYLS